MEQEIALMNKRESFSQFVNILPFDSHIKSCLKDMENKITYGEITVDEALTIVGYSSTVARHFIDHRLKAELMDIDRAAKELKLAKDVERAHE